MSSATLPDPGAYGRNWASVYDDLFDHRDDTAAVVRLVTSLAPHGPILELGVGSGRLAIPLAASGREVTGVDASREMLDRLREKPGGSAVTVVEGDMTSVALDERFACALIAFSTLFLLPSQEAQIQCLRNAAAHLTPGGVLLVEAFVPDHQRWTRGQNVSITTMSESTVELQVGLHDAADQVIRTQQLSFGPDGLTLRPNTLRYVWPSELDVMCLLAGLRRVGRWSDWNRSPFTATSTAHVSAYS